MPPDLDFPPAYHSSSRPCSTSSPLSSSPLMTDNPLLNHVPAAVHLPETAFALPRAGNARMKAGAEVRVKDHGDTGDRMSTMTAGRRRLRGRLYDCGREDTSAGSRNVVIEGDKQDDEDATVLSHFSSSDDDEEDNEGHDANAEANAHDNRDSFEREDTDDLDLSGDTVEVDLVDSNLHPRRRDIHSSYDHPGQRMSDPPTSPRHRGDPTPYPSRPQLHTLQDGHCDVPKTQAHGNCPGVD